MATTTSGRVVVWGGTGQAKVARPMIEALGLRVACVCDRDTTVSTPFDGVPIFHHGAELLGWLQQAEREALRFVAAVGGTQGRERLRIDDYLCRLGMEPISLIHHSAFIDGSACVASGAQVAAMAAVCVGAVIGRQCIVNTGAIIDHDVVLGDGVHVMPGATLAGLVKVGSGASIGSNATILPRVSIGADAIVGAGAVVIRSVAERATVVGVPARQIAVRQPNNGRRVNPWEPGFDA